MPRVLFINRYFDPDESATSQLLTDLARALALDGMEIHVVCSRQRYDDSRADLPAEEMLAGVHVHRIATTRFGRARLIGRSIDYASFYGSTFVTLCSQLARGDVLVVKTDPPLMSVIAAPIARLRHAFLINWQQDIFPEIATALGANPLPGVLNRLCQRLRDSSMRAAASNVVIGSRMREYLAARGIAREKLVIIENWADSDAIRPQKASTSNLRSHLGLLDRFVVGYSGNLGRPHEFDTWLEAATLLRRDAHIVFLIIGGGAKMAALKRAVMLRNLENFRFLPYQPRESLQDSLSAADVHMISLLPQLEGLIVPSKLYGILAAGRPVISIGDPRGEVARVISGASCGFNVAVGDSQHLANVLEDLAKHADERAAMGARAREAFCERFTRGRAVGAWNALIGSVVDAQSADYQAQDSFKHHKGSATEQPDEMM